MADVSMSESQIIPRHRFIDHTDSYTYKVPRNRDDVEGIDWILNCVVSMKAQIEVDDESDSDGGLLATVTFPDRASYGTYIPDSVWSSLDQFRTALRQYSRGMPPILCTFSHSDFQKYGEDRIRAFTRDKPELSSKKRVTRLGKQNDGKTFIFGPDAVFAEKEGVVKKTTLDATEYAWIPSLLREMSVAASGPDVGDLFRDAVAAFKGKSMYAFCLTLGAFYMGMHYDLVVDTFHRCPVVVCLGKTNCGKTYAVTRSANLVATNAASVLEHKSVISAAARKILSQQSMPVLIHDPPVVDALKTMIEETFDRKSVTTTKDKFMPHTSVIVTCNFDVIGQLRNGDQVRGPVRLAIIPFNDEFPEQTAHSFVDSADQPTSSEEVLGLLLQMGKKGLDEIATLMDADDGEMSAKLLKYGMQESVNRISFNIRMLHAFAVKGLVLLDQHQTVDLDGLHDFVMDDVVKCAVMWQKPSETKRKYEVPAFPVSPMKKCAHADDPSIITRTLEIVARLLGPDETKQVMRSYSRNNGKEYVAFKDARALEFLKRRGLETGFISDLQESVINVPNYVPSWDVRFAKDKNSVKGMLIPISVVSPSLLSTLSGQLGTSETHQQQLLRRSAAIVSDEASTSSDPRTCQLDATGDDAHADVRQLSGEDVIESEAEKDKQGVLKESPPAHGSDRARFHLHHQFVRDCSVSQKGFPIKNQRLDCKTCKNPFHRNCQAVKTGTFQGDRADSWKCKTCKLSAKQGTLIANAKQAISD